MGNCELESACQSSQGGVRVRYRQSADQNLQNFRALCYLEIAVATEAVGHGHAQGRSKRKFKINKRQTMNEF